MAKMSVEQALLRAKALERKGQTEEARQLYAEMLAAYPNNHRLRDAAGALKSAATAPPPEHLQELARLYGAGRLDQVLSIAGKLVQHYPSSFMLWNMMGTVLAQTGRTNEAVDAFKRACALNPGFPDAHNNLGNALKDLGDFTAALASYDRVLKLDPNFASAHYNRGNALREMGQHEDAAKAYRRTIALKPNFADAHNNLGNVLQQLAEVDTAIEHFKKAISLRPGYADAYNNLGVLYKKVGRLAEAEDSLKTALELDPQNPDILNSMGVTLKDLGRPREAIEILGKAVALSPEFATAFNNLGNVQTILGDHHGAVESFVRALALTPDFAEAESNLGAALRVVGRLDEARAAFERALVLDPRLFSAHAFLSTMKTFTPDDPQLETLRALYLDETVSDSDRHQVAAALFKAMEDCGNLPEAFHYLKEANALRKKLMKYNIAEDHTAFSALRQAHEGLRLQALSLADVPKSVTPIFVLGMPRSGTTLVEQIISNHPLVTGAGELSYVRDLGLKLASGEVSPSQKALMDFRAAYLEKLTDLSDGKTFVTDKLPHNFLYVGLICAAFPEAKIVHLNRDPAAVCWSNYKHFFGSNGLGYCYDLADVVEYYGLYRELMAFWNEQCPGRIYQLDYERLTIDQEAGTRQLISYLGLPWDEACLAPQDNKRGIRTVSQLQVRKKIYSGSSEAWRKYEAFLGGAFDTLTN